MCQNDLNWWCCKYSCHLSTDNLQRHTWFKDYFTVSHHITRTHTDQNTVIYAHFLDDLLPPTRSNQLFFLKMELLLLHSTTKSWLNITRPQWYSSLYRNISVESGWTDLMFVVSLQPWIIGRECFVWSKLESILNRVSYVYSLREINIINKTVLIWKLQLTAQFQMII